MSVNYSVYRVGHFVFVSSTARIVNLRVSNRSDSLFIFDFYREAEKTSKMMQCLGIPPHQQMI